MGELLSAMTAIEGDGEVGREETVRSLLDTRKAVEELGMVSGERDQLSSSLQTTLLQLETAQGGCGLTADCVLPLTVDSLVYNVYDCTIMYMQGSPARLQPN